MSDDGHTIRIVLVDDQPIVRCGLRHLLEAQPSCTVAAEAGTPEATLLAVREHAPDVVILGLSLGGEGTLGTIARLSRLAPATGIVVLTPHSDGVRDALLAGASAYVLTGATADDLVTAVHTAAAGGTYLNPGLAGLLADTPAAEDLTRREHDVLQLLALGYTNAEIADRMFLSRRTIEAHRASVQRKLGLSTRAELTRHALDRRLIAA